MTTKETAKGPRVLVGVDGSENSMEAVAWAEDYVRLTGGVLELVTCWFIPVQYGFPVLPLDHDAQAQAKALLEDVAGKVALDPGRVRKTVLFGHAANELVTASRDADLLVLGTRGHGGFAGLLLGSVSGFCSHHAHCSVVIVRPPTSEAAS